jgi:hypothetical protein
MCGGTYGGHHGPRHDRASNQDRADRDSFHTERSRAHRKSRRGLRASGSIAKLPPHLTATVWAPAPQVSSIERPSSLASTALSPGRNGIERRAAEGGRASRRTFLGMSHKKAEQFGVDGFGIGNVQEVSSALDQHKPFAIWNTSSDRLAVSRRVGFIGSAV